jgi:hypothetical protein
LFTNSPESFHYAVEGYFDIWEDRTMTFRNVAKAAFWGTDSEFNKFWPLPTKYNRAKVRNNMTPEEFRAWYGRIKEKYKFK